MELICKNNWCVFNNKYRCCKMPHPVIGCFGKCTEYKKIVFQEDNEIIKEKEKENIEDEKEDAE